MSEFLQLETQDGVRMTWNVIPGTKQDAANCVVPVSAIYTPLNPNSDIPVLPYAPLRCRICRSILNPFSMVDFNSKLWLCPFCFHRNHFPQQYSTVSPTNLPAELFLIFLPLSTWPLLKQGLYRHQSSCLLLILA